MTFTKTKAWIAGAVAIWLLMSVAAWFLLISPKRAEASDLRDQTAQVDAQNQQTEARIATLKKQAAQMPKMQTERDGLRAELPVDDQLAELTRRLNSISQATGTTMDAITPGAPSAVAAPAAAAGAAGSTPAASTAGLVQVPVTVSVTGGYSQALDFLKHLQTDSGRNYLVQSISIGDPKLIGAGADTNAAKAKGWVSMTIVGSVFALPESATTAAASAATPSSTTGTAATGSTSTDATTTAN